MPPANPARACSCLCMFERASRQSGRAASAGGHHGGPRRATRRSHPDSPGSGAAPTLCPVAAQMTATKGSVTPSSHEVLRLRPRARVFSRPGRLPRAYADQCIHAGRSFFSPSKGFFSNANGGSVAFPNPGPAADQGSSLIYLFFKAKNRSRHSSSSACQGFLA